MVANMYNTSWLTKVSFIYLRHNGANSFTFAYR